MTQESHYEWSQDLSSYFGNAAFYLLNNRLFNFSLTWILLRCAIRPQGESKTFTILSGVTVTAITVSHDYLREKNTIENHSLSYGVLAASYIYPHHISEHRGLNFIISLSAGVVGSYSTFYIFTNYETEDILSASLGAFTYAKLYQNTPPRIHRLLPIILPISLTCAPTLFKYIIPIDEVKESYKTLAIFVNKETLNQKLADLYVTIFNTQTSITYLAFHHFCNLKRIESSFKGNQPSLSKKIIHFIIASAFVRAIQTVADTSNLYRTKEFEGWLQTEFKSQYAFNEENFAAISSSNSSITSYANDIRNIASIHSQLAKKISSLQRIALIPNEMLHLKEFIPLIASLLFIDQTKSYALSFVSHEVIKTEKELLFTYDKYRKIEENDAQHHTMLDDISMRFIQKRYLEKAQEIQWKNIKLSTLESVKSHVNTVYWNDLLQSLPMVFLQNKSNPTEIIIHIKSIQDIIELALSRLKEKSYYTRVKEGSLRLTLLHEFIQSHSPQKLIVLKTNDTLKISNLSFERIKDNIVQTYVNIPDLTLEKGKIYALSGANGSGKSSLFNIITNSIDESLRITSHNYTLLAPNRQDIISITQQHYCPLYIKPIDLINNFFKEDFKELQIIQLMQELNFYISNTSEETYKAFLHQEHPNLYQSLSGGQIAKIELIKHVFLKEHCPKLLLIDEALSSLDNVAKNTIYDKLKIHCKESIVIVTHHLEPNANCVPSYDFFEAVIELKNNIISLTGVCGD
jgi:ABC-type lipoprotein export system ATPase subunit